MCRQLVQLGEILLGGVERRQVGGVRAAKLARSHLHQLLATNHWQLEAALLLALLLEDGRQARCLALPSVILLQVRVEGLSLAAQLEVAHDGVLLLELLLLSVALLSCYLVILVTAFRGIIRDLAYDALQMCS